VIAGLDKDHCIVLREGKFDTNEGSDASDLSRIFGNIAQQGKPVVIHFHGGLVDKASGVAAANVLRPDYEGAGAYPVFFVWQSGWEDVLQNKLPAIFNEPFFQKALTFLSQFAKAKVDKAQQRGIARAAGGVPVPPEPAVRAELTVPANGKEPFADVDPRAVPPGDELTPEELAQFRAAVEADPTLAAMATQLTQPGPTIAGAPSLVDANALGPAVLGLPSAVSQLKLAASLAGVLAAVIKRFADRRDHGFYPTIVEEICRAFYVGSTGRFVWSAMKQEIDDAFGVATDCGGTQFITQLQQLNASGHKPRITLVGHSAGAIYACRFLQEVQSRGLPADVRFDLITIAPACDFAVLAKTLQSAAARIDRLRVFGMDDARESVNAIVPVVYPRSLLYFVSGVAEDEDDCPLVGMQRYYGSPYDDASQFPEIDYVRKTALFQDADAMRWALAAGGPGLDCDMRSHGGWVSDAPQTLASVKHIIQSGF
jgi:hypothetical protein